MKIGFSFKNVETIEKSKKGVRRSQHKYIRVFTGNDGKDRYLYPADFTNPFKLLLSVFKVTRERVASIFTENNIEKEYGVDQDTFAAHVLEYLTARSKWDKFFSDPIVSHQNKKPVNLKPKKPGEKKNKKKNGEKKFTINRSLMRKIWAVFNPVEEKKQEAEYEENNSDIEQGRISKRDQGVRSDSRTSSNENGDSSGDNGAGRSNTEFDTDKPGIRSGNAASDRDGRGNGSGIEETEQEKYENRSNAMLGNDNAKKDFHKMTFDELWNLEKELEDAGKLEEMRAVTEELRKRPEWNALKPKWDSDTVAAYTDIKPAEDNTPAIPDEVKPFIVGRMTKGQILKIRAQCEEILKKPDNEITEEEKNILRQYAGAGGTGAEDVNDTRVLNEYYTPFNVINKVWQLVDKYDPRTNKKVIEPSSGIGRFAEGRKEKFTMFELIPETSRINKILHPDANVYTGEFQKNFMSGGMFYKGKGEKFDVAVGNPPYGDYSGLYKGMGEGKEHSYYDEYFIDRTLDTLKDGGILAMVVPSRFLDGKDSAAKRKIAEKGKLLEAWRLPEGTFETTGVGTDIIIIRKEKGDVNDFNNGNFFKNNPDCICGVTSEKTNQWGQLVKYTALENGKNVDDQLNGIDVEKFKNDRTPIPEVTTEITDFPDWVGKKFTVNKKTRKVTVSDKAQEHKNRSEAMRGNQNAAGEHNYTGKLMTSAEFNKLYGKTMTQEEIDIWKTTDVDGVIQVNTLTDKQKEYVEKSGNYVKDLSGNWQHIANYQSGNIAKKLEQLEIDYKDKEDPDYLYKKGLLEEVLPPVKTIDKLGLSPLENWARDYKVKINDNEMTLIDAFFYWAYNGNNYYSASNSPITPYEIPAGISFSDVEDYINKISVRAERVGKDASKEDRNYVQKQAMKKRDIRMQTAEKLFNRFLKDGLDKENAEKLVADYNKQYCFVNPDYKKIPVFVEGMCDHKGSKEFKLLDQQIKGVSFLANKGSGLLAYDVGVGKTAAGIVATVNQIQSGRAKKPLICVPKAVYKNWIKSIKQHFPNQEVVELGNLGSQYTHGKKVEIPEGAITVCTYQALNRITFHDETIKNEIATDVEAANLKIESAAPGEEVSTKPKSKRQLIQEKEKKDELLGSVVTAKGDEVFCFEDLGFDHITVDEVHNFKNVFSVPRNFKLKADEDESQGESNEFSKIHGSTSARGKKLFAITQYIQRHNEDRNVYLLSATPFTNSPTEIYSMLSLVARKRLHDLGIYSLHEFLARFAEIKSEYVVKPNNSVVEEQVVKSFKKLDKLQALLTEYIDKVDGEEAGVIRPHKVVHTPELNLTPIQKEYIDEQIKYMENADKDDTAATIVAMNNMRMAVLSPALVIPELSDQFVESSPKMKFVCDTIIKQYKENKKNGQVIYLPRGTGTKTKDVTDPVDGFEQCKQYLIRNGVPAEAIGFMRGGDSTEKALDAKEALKNDFNNPDGKCKILIGSGTIQEGVSLNGNSSVIYNCMLGWNPSETTQVEGRIWRQGNKQGVTHIVYPLMNDSIDALMYQKYDEKQSRINELWKYKGDSLNVEDINPEELKFGLIKDPEKRADLQIIQEKERLDSEVRQLGMSIDILHKLEKIAFSDPDEEIKNDFKLQRAKDDLKENSVFMKNMEYFKEQAEKYEKIAKELEKLPKDTVIRSLDDIPEKIKEKYGMDRYDVSAMIGYYSTSADLKTAVDRMREKAETNKNSYLESRQTKAYQERYVRNREKEIRGKILAAKDSLNRQAIATENDLLTKISILVTEKSEKQALLDGMKDRKEELKQKAIEDIKRSQKTLPSLDEMVNVMNQSIQETLKPMDEVKTWIKAGREAGKTNEEIKREIDSKIGVNKSIRFGILKNGNEKLSEDQKEDQMFIKAFEYCDFYLGRSYNVGDLRTWKGKVFRLNKSGTWERFI